MKADTENTSVYLVHLWPSEQVPSGFQAAVRRVDRDRSECFTQAQALTNYFQEQARTACAESSSQRPERGVLARALQGPSASRETTGADPPAPVWSAPALKRGTSPAVVDLLHVDFDAYERRAQQLRRDELARLAGLCKVAVLSAARAAAAGVKRWVLRWRR